MEDLEEKVAMLESDNFELKMRVYYSNQKAGKMNAETDLKNPEKLVSLIEDQYIDKISLRAANTAAHRRISDLESQLTEIRAKSTAESFVADSDNPVSRSILMPPKLYNMNNSNSQKVGLYSQIDKQAALAVAEHDTVVIRRLESEVFNLRSQHALDVNLVKDSAQRVSNLLKENEGLNTKISVNEDHIHRLATQVRALTEQLKASEILLEKQKCLTASSILSQSNFSNENKSIDDVIYLRNENANLRQQLYLEKNLRRDQYTTLEKVRLSAEEMTILLAEEITWLEDELSKSLDENEMWQTRWKQAERQLQRSNEQGNISDHDHESGFANDYRNINSAES